VFEIWVRQQKDVGRIVRKSEEGTQKVEKGMCVLQIRIAE